MLLRSRVGVRQARRRGRKKRHADYGGRSSKDVWGGLGDPFSIVLLQQEVGSYTEIT